VKLKLVIIVGLVSMLLLGASCTRSQDFDNQVGSIVEPYRFSIAGWEFKTLPSDVKEPSKGSNVEDESGTVIEYFSLAQRIRSLESEIEVSTSNGQGALPALKTKLDQLLDHKAALEATAERILRGQITEVLAEQGIFNPVDKYIKLKISFPPLFFKLEEPPNLLVVSPRDRIDRISDILLQPNTSLQEEVDIEARVDKLGVSSLVVPLGGLATYPSFVADDSGLKSAIDATTEEWVHQYLTFQPLGFLYLLDTTGISRNYDVATIDETVASMVSKEIGALVYKKYYSTQGSDDGQVANPELDFFNQEMREIRKAVDEYLAQGQIDQAEQFMEAKRQYLASRGYYIRKLNQAYFAFYGTYADSPTSISPIGSELKELRSKSASLKDFMATASAITSRQALQTALKD
jgi:hypothetical protein